MEWFRLQHFWYVQSLSNSVDFTGLHARQSAAEPEAEAGEAAPHHSPESIPASRAPPPRTERHEKHEKLDEYP